VRLPRSASSPGIPEGVLAGGDVEQTRSLEARDAFDHRRPLVVLDVSLDLQPDVGRVEALGDDPGVAQVESLDDLLAHRRRGRRGQRHHGRAAESFQHRAEPEVVGPEVVSPRGDAVCLVHHEEADPGLRQQLHHLVLGQLLRGEEEVLRRAVPNRVPGVFRVLAALGRVDRHRLRQPGCPLDAHDLVALQGDQRRDDHRRAIEERRRHLVDRRLAGPAVEAGVEVLVGLRCLVESELVGDDERRLGPPGDDQVAQLAVVLLDGALPGADADALGEGGAIVEGHPPVLRFFGGGLGILGDVDADDADVPGGPDDLDVVVEDELGMLLAGLVVGLVPDTLDATVDAKALGGLHHGLGRVGLREVDGDGTDLRGQGQAGGLLVDHEDPGRAAEHGAVGGHQADRAGAEDGDGLARRHHGQLSAVVARGKDVAEHGEVGLVVIALGQVQQVEVGPRDAQHLGLPAPVGTHLGVAVPGAGSPDGFDLRHAEV